MPRIIARFGRDECEGSVPVASAALVQVACKTPRQMRLVNALCRYVEIAGEQAQDYGGFNGSTRTPS